jgi:hypothetical protein
VTQNLLIHRITQLLGKLQDLLVVSLTEDCFGELSPRPVGRLTTLIAQAEIVRTAIVRTMFVRTMFVLAVIRFTVIVRHPARHPSSHALWES